MTPEILALMGLILSSMVFYFYAKSVNKEPLTLDGFMLANRQLSKNQFSNTLAASSFSLALTIMFFFSNNKIYGLCMLISPISYLLGQYVFVWTVKRANINFKDCRTISDLCYQVFPSRSLARLITIMTISSFIMTVFVELYIGSVVLTVFLPQHIFYQTLSFFILGSLVLLYVRLGGYKALVKTDLWQLTFMLSATAVISVYALIAPIKPLTLSFNDMLPKLLFFSESTLSVIVFCAWLTFMNLIMPFTQISYWQRVSATKSTHLSWLGLIQASWKILFLFTLPILGFVLLGAKGYDFADFPAFLESIRVSSTFTGFVLFPLLIVGLCSTVFSSADTAIMAIAYTLSDKHIFLKQFSNMNEKQLRKTLTRIIVSLLILLSLIYWLQFTGLQDWLVPLFYAICGQLVILSPIPIFILLKSSQSFTPLVVNTKALWVLFATIVFTWILLLISVWLSKYAKLQVWSQLVTPIGACLVGCAILFVCKKPLNQFAVAKTQNAIN